MGNKLSRCPELPLPDLPEGYAVATLALGCFWGPDKEFRDTKGIVNVVVGYTGGKEPNPTYKDIKDHAEAVRIVYRTFYTYEDIVEMFFNRHKPLPYVSTGTQYRSAIFVHSEEQREAAERVKENRLKRGMHAVRNTTIEDAGPFYKAEEYHQNYINKSRKTWGAFF